MRALRYVFAVAALGLVAFLGGMLIMDLAMGIVVRRGEVTLVPDVSGLPYEEAARALADAKLDLFVEREVSPAEADSGEVVRQFPGAGMRVKQGRRIALTLSKGPEWSVVPEVVGARVRQARIVLASSGLLVEADAYVAHESIERDVVIATFPVAGSPAAEGDPVRLLVSLGPAPTGFLMPDLTGRALDDVNRHLRLFQLSRPRVTYDGDPEAEPGRVLAQSPSPGSRVDGETPIELTVSSP
ncbi:MAG: PASTA domain-containing protein [Candidatus Latescibacterota bacterium]|nr:MAG: PASTA domain-containing protein [Candidatus Latescibacterota bacterium]